MDLTTSYLGLTLKNPLVAASSPLSNDVDSVKRLEDAGAAAVVMYSLFEEQINHEQEELDHFLSYGTDSFAEALSYFPQPQDFANIDCEEYLKHISNLKESVSIPVIASLNGVSKGGWMRYAKLMQEAGADALELNIFYVPTDPSLTAVKVEQMYVEDIKAVKESASLPVALKLGASFTSFANFAAQVDRAGANGLVLFNRFFGPDIDLEDLKVVSKLRLSTPAELQVPLRWIAVLYGNVKADLAASSGIHSADDAIKAVMAGASVTQLASVLLTNGVEFIGTILEEMQHWMAVKEYESISQMKGSMSYQSVAEPAAYERANYMKTLQSYD